MAHIGDRKQAKAKCVHRLRLPGGHVGCIQAISLQVQQQIEKKSFPKCFPRQVLQKHCSQIASLDLPEIMFVDTSIERNTVHFDCRMYS